MMLRTWGSTAEERQLTFPCERHLPHHDDALFRAVDVHAPPPILFRWLCQLRVAPYSYDWIDNFGRRSPRELTPGLEDLSIGQRVMSIFELAEFERDRHLTLRLDRARRVFGDIAVTYLVLPASTESCRLVVKMVVVPRGPALLRPAMRRVLPAADLIMMRRQLLNLKQLAERDAVRDG